eukprot:EG_transcript_945
MDSLPADEESALSPDGSPTGTHRSGSWSLSLVRMHPELSPTKAPPRCPSAGGPSPVSSAPCRSRSSDGLSRYASDQSQALLFPALGAAMTVASGRRCLAVPSWRACATPEWVAAVVSVVPLAVLAGCWFAVDGLTTAGWYAALYASTALAMLLFVALHFALSTQRLLCQLATVLTTDESQPAPDHRLRFLQLALQARPTIALAPADPLAFMWTELQAWALQSEGYVVTNATGVILWANAALLHYFGYAKEELLQQNVRVLMPNPYASQHDYFMRRHVNTGVCCMLGKAREVPALDKSGGQSVVMLELDRRTDPLDAANQLFVGRIDFHREDPRLQAAREALAAMAGRPTEALRGLDDVREPVVASDAQGTVLFANAAACTVFQWTPAELVGENVRVLMAEPFASAHDGFMQAYLRRAEAAQQQGLTWPPSRLVGSGRDVMAMAKSGQRVRVFLMVTRLDRPSGDPRHCVFVAKMVPVSPADGSPPTSPLEPGAASPVRLGAAGWWGSPGSPARSLRTASPPLPSRGGGGSTASCCSIDGSAEPPVTHAVPPVKLRCFERRRCTAVVLALEEVGGGGGPAAPDDLGVVLELVGSHCSHHRGVPYWLVGAQLVVVFNAPGQPNACHRFSAASFMLQVAHAFAHTPAARRCVLRAAAAAADGLWGSWGCHPLLTGHVLQHAGILLHAHRESQVCNPVLDGPLHQELQYSHSCRLVNRASVSEPGAPPTVLEVYELVAPREGDPSVWMYQLPAAAPPPSPWALAWRRLPLELDPQASPRPLLEEACRLVQLSLDECPTDTTACWLLAVLQSLGRHPRRPGALRRCGPLTYRLQFDSLGSVGWASPRSQEVSVRCSPHAWGSPNRSSGRDG